MPDTLTQPVTPCQGTKDWSPRGPLGFRIFPYWAALYNPVEKKAWALRKERLWSPSKTTVLMRETVQRDVSLLLEHTEIPQSDAVLLVRPFIHLRGGPDPEKEQRLLACRAYLTLDEEVAMPGETPLEEILVRVKGIGLQTRPYLLPRPGRGALTFSALRLYDGMADGNQFLGLFVPNKTAVELRLHGDIGAGEPIEVVAGVIGAVYTTRA